MNTYSTDISTVIILLNVFYESVVRINHGVALIFKTSQNNDYFRLIARIFIF